MHMVSITSGNLSFFFGGGGGGGGGLSNQCMQNSKALP